MTGLFGDGLMPYRKNMVRVAVSLVLGAVLYLIGGFLLTPKIDVAAHKPVGDALWLRIKACWDATGHFPVSEAALLDGDVFTLDERKLFLDRNFGHRKFHYSIDRGLGPILTLNHMPGALYAVSVWKMETNAGAGTVVDRSSKGSASE